MSVHGMEIWLACSTPFVRVKLQSQEQLSPCT